MAQGVVMPETGHTSRAKARLPHSPARPRRCLLGVDALPAEAAVAAREATAASGFAFRANDYYLSLINWDDPADPISRLVVPHGDEGTRFGSLDPSDEASNTLMPGLQHKYADTALLLVTDQCAGFCRYCFRKRLFITETRETRRRCGPGIEYIAAHPEITDVLLTGGDPLVLSTARLRDIVERIMEIPHVRTIRIGSKVPAFDPYRITADPSLGDLTRDVVASGRAVYFMTHFDHPREMTAEARDAVAMLRSAGALCANQSPITRGINDDPGALAELFETCTVVGCPQYYVFQCRPTLGNAPFTMPITRAFDIVSRGRARGSRLSPRPPQTPSNEEGRMGATMRSVVGFPAPLGPIRA
jgi:KamA family protein